MKLISCQVCGVVLDADRIVEPEIRFADGTIDMAVARWKHEKYVSIIPCPVCKAEIFYQSGDDAK